MQDIRHEGMVLRVRGQLAHVRILQASACAGCHARQMCQGADVSEKEMDCVMMTEMQVGDKVEVVISESMGWKAVAMGYIVPFLILLLVVTLVVERGYGEAMAGVLALGVLAVYYVLLWLLRGKIEKQFSFRAYRED